jgi:hypothetical protein
MRASASAAYLLVVTFIGLALGPYTIGRISAALGDLRTAMAVALLANLAAAGFLWRGMRNLARDRTTLLARARAAGEQGI